MDLARDIGIPWGVLQLACAGAEAAEPILLRLCPAVGEKHTMCVVLNVASSRKTGERQMDGNDLKKFVFAVETVALAADGQVSCKVALEAIQDQMQIGGRIVAEYDSTRPRTGPANEGARTYADFVGKSWTIKVTSKGQVTDPGLDELFQAVAQARVDQEDANTREQLKDKAAQAIEAANQRAGSSANRVLARKKELEESPAFGRDDIRVLLESLFASLPEKAVPSGGSWSAPVLIQIGAAMELPTTYILQAVDDRTCTIEASGKGDTRERPFIYSRMGHTVINKLAGTARSTLKIDRKSGWLLHRDQKASFAGQMEFDSPGRTSRDAISQMTIEVTAGVELIK